METNSLTMAAALSGMYGVTNAVDRQDWDEARSRLHKLRAAYGRH